MISDVSIYCVKNLHTLTLCTICKANYIFKFLLKLLYIMIKIILKNKEIILNKNTEI